MFICSRNRPAVGAAGCRPQDRLAPGGALLPLADLTGGSGTTKGITALVGLDPKPHQSGRSVHRRSSISKMGNAEMRKLLYMGALSAVHGQNPLHDFYERLVAQGKPRKVAVVAAARKLLTWAWTLFQRKTAWNPALHAR